MKRRWKYFSVFRLGIIAVVFSDFLGISQAAFATLQEPVQSASLETYDAVVDHLFDVGSPSRTSIQYQFIARFVPGGIQPEAQIVIETKPDGSVEVTHYSLPKGSESIYLQINALKAKLGTENVQQIAQNIKVQVRKADVFPSCVRDFIMEFAQLELKPPMETSLWLDAATYTLTFRTNSNELRYSLVGSRSCDSPREYPLIRWMCRVKEYVEQAETKE